MASLVTTASYQREINKLCSQIHNLRFDSKNVKCGRGRRGEPALLNTSNQKESPEDVNLGAVDEESLVFFSDLTVLSEKLKTLENFMGDSEEKCDSRKIALLIAELKTSIECIKSKGQGVYESLVTEEKTLNSEIKSLLSYIDLLNEDTITKTGKKFTPHKSYKQKLVNSSKQEDSMKVLSRSPILRLSDVTIWSPKDYVILEKVCRLHSDEKIRLGVCSKLLPHKCEMEISIYMKKYLQEIERKEAIKSKISKWRETKSLYEKESRQRLVIDDSSTKCKRPKTARGRPLLVSLKSVERLSKPRPKTASSVEQPKSCGSSQRYSAEEREAIKNKLQQHREKKNTQINKINDSNQIKIVKISLKKFQERDKAFIAMRMKTLSSKQISHNKVFAMKNKVPVRSPQESTLMKPTQSIIYADKSRIIKSPRKAFGSQYNDVDSIPKRKTPHWRNQM